MESETNPNVALKPPPLNSDQLNYLIWRYLQEAGYGEAAVKLQRDWKVEQPENLPFAKHIKGQALVSLVQKGLRYHHLSLTIDENGQPAKPPNPSAFYFGPESARPASSSSSKEPLYRPIEAPSVSSPPIASSSIPKKRETDFNGAIDSASAPAKRSRKTTQGTVTDRNGNGVRKTSASAGDASTAMEVDHVNGSTGSLRNVRSPSVSENVHDDNVMNGAGIDTRMDVDMEESNPLTSGMDGMPNDMHETLPTLVHTLTNGESVGVQVAPAKVANLVPSTTILSLTEDSHVTRNIWQPADGSLLTVAGDHFCGAWRSTKPGALEDGSRMVYQDLLSSNKSLLITAIAWEPSGGLLAIATYSDQPGQLHLYDGRELILIENLPASQRAITSLKWLPSTLRLVGIAPYEDQTRGQETSSTILLWDFSGMQFSAAPLTLTVPEVLLDVDSTRHAGHDAICAAGGNAVYHCHTTKELTVEDKWMFPTEDPVNWTFVRCSWQGGAKPIVVAASSDTAQIWLPAKDIARSGIHDAPITGLELRPRAFRTGDAPSVVDFATSSLDCTIKLWRLDHQSNSLEVIHKLSIGQGYPIMSLSFSPDGFCLAGASYGNARIWNAEHGYNLMATWEATSEEWRGTILKDEDAMSTAGLSSLNGDGGSLSADHSLAWDPDSKKLAFGLASQVAIINFQR